MSAMDKRDPGKAGEAMAKHAAALAGPIINTPQTFEEFEAAATAIAEKFIAEFKDWSGRYMAEMTELSDRLTASGLSDTAKEAIGRKLVALMDKLDEELK